MPKGNHRKSKSKKNRIVGSGKFTLKNAGRSLVKGAKIANRVASTGAFGPQAQTLSRMITGLSSKLKGSGAYSSVPVNCNSLFPHSSTQAPPSFSSSTTGCVTMVHREYIGDLYSGTGSPSNYTATTFSINPGLDATFPFLSQIAQNFDSYKFLGLVFEFKTTSGMVSGSNQSLGTVALACQYNVYDPPFINKFQLENYEGAISCAPYENAILGVECKPSLLVAEHLYTRIGAIQSGTDQRLYDVGTVTVATQGVQSASSNLGELWVSYHVELYQPKLFATLGLGATFFSANCTTGPTGALPFLGMATDPSSTLGITLTNNTIFFPLTAPDGIYQCTYIATGATTSLTAFTYGYTNITQWVDPRSAGSGNLGNSVTASETISVLYVQLETFGKGLQGSVQFNSGAIPTSISHALISVIQLPYDL